MSTSVNWPVIGGSTYSVPAAGEVNWPSLSDFLVALGNTAQGVGPQKIASRIAVTTPVTVASSTDCLVVTDLTVPGPVAVNLPAGVVGQYFMIADGKGDASTNNITITPNGAETIQGAANIVISADRGAVILVFRGTNWYIVAEFSSFSTGFIPRSKIAPATPDYVVINDNTGALSEEQYLNRTRGGTGITSTATFPASGTIVTRTSTDTGADRLQNKDLDDDTTGFVDSGDTTKRLEVETSGSTTGTTTTVSTSSTASRNVTLPDATTTLVGRDTVDTGANRLKTKDLETSSIRFVDPSDTTKTLAVDTSANTTGADTVIADTATADRTVTLQDGSYTVVGRTTTDTLTNKSLVDASTSIVDSVDATKTILFDAGGTTGTSSTITGAQTANRVITLPDATTTLVGLDTTDDLSNKSFTTPVVVKAAGTVQFNNAGNTFSTSLQGGATAADVTFVLPLVDGSAGEVISTDGAGNLSFINSTGIVSEYVSNSSSTDADDTTSFVTSINGSAGVIGVTALTAVRFKRVQFSSSLTAGDQITLEVLDNGVWLPFVTVVPVTNAGLANAYRNLWQYGASGITTVGVGIQSVSGNPDQLDIAFGRFCVLRADTAGTGGEWDQVTSSTAWRVRRVRFL